MKKLIIVLFLISNIFADSIKIGLVHNISTGEIPNGINIYSYLVSPTQNWGVFYRQKNENDYKCIFAIYDIKHNTLIEQISDKNLCNNEDIEDGYELYNGSFFQPFIDKYKNKIELLSQKYNLNDSFDYSNVIINKSKQLNYIFTIKTNQEKKDVLYKDDRLIFIDATKKEILKNTSENTSSKPTTQKKQEEKSFFSKLLEWLGFSKLNENMSFMYS